MKLAERMREIAENERVEHILIPRGVFLRMMGILFLNVFAVAVFRSGIFVIFSVFALFLLVFWVRACVSVWSRYYARFSFLLAFAVQIALAEGALQMIAYFW